MFSSWTRLISIFRLVGRKLGKHSHVYAKKNIRNLSFCIETSDSRKLFTLQPLKLYGTGWNLNRRIELHLITINSLVESWLINEISKIFSGAIVFAVLLFQIPGCNWRVLSAKCLRSNVEQRREKERKVESFVSSLRRKFWTLASLDYPLRFAFTFAVSHHPFMSKLVQEIKTIPTLVIKIWR